MTKSERQINRRGNMVLGTKVENKRGVEKSFRGRSLGVRMT
jgi:hypothetical protein